MWDRSIDVTILSYSVGHIDCIVCGEVSSWHFTGFYGNPTTEQRKFSWQLLRRIAASREHRDMPWLVGGDFNEILMDTEKQGGRVRPMAQMDKFREAIFDCNLHEVAFPDRSLTWFNNRENDEIFERLDRFLGDKAWQETFTQARTEVLDFFGSDHRPVLCMIGGKEEKVICKGRGRFHFEEKWLLDKQLVPDLACEWSFLGDVPELPKKMKMCGAFLKRWAKGKFDNLGKQIQIMRKERQKLLDEKKGKLNARAILDISRKIEKAVEMEACHWKQRARINWLANGDRNTRPFIFRPLEGVRRT